MKKYLRVLSQLMTITALITNDYVEATKIKPRGIIKVSVKHDPKLDQFSTKGYFGRFKEEQEMLIDSMNPMTILNTDYDISEMAEIWLDEDGYP